MKKVTLGSLLADAKGVTLDKDTKLAVLQKANEDHIAAAQKVIEANRAFASALLSKGGLMEDHSVSPPLLYTASPDGLSYETKPIAGPDDTVMVEGEEEPPPAPAPEVSPPPPEPEGTLPPEGTPATVENPPPSPATNPAAAADQEGLQGPQSPATDPGDQADKDMTAPPAGPSEPSHAYKSGEEEVLPAQGGPEPHTLFGRRRH